MKTLILASTSPRRKLLLEQAGFSFLAVASDFEEFVDDKLSPYELVKTLALGKAQAVAAKYPQAVILSGDTIVVLGRTIFGKPQDAQHAKEILRALSGKQHSVITGFALLDTASQHVLSEAMEAKVWFKNLSDEVIDAYLATGEPFDKAGAYALQGKGRDLVEKIEGEDSVVIGLPIERVTILLDQFGIKKEN